MNSKNLTYNLEINHFADRKFNMVKFNKKNECHNCFTEEKLGSATEDMIPHSVDWRNHGVVTNVKNQGECGSCWSFSSTGSIEGINAIKFRRLHNASEQQLMDCSIEEGNHVLVTAHTSAGKSTIADAIHFAVFGNTIRDLKKDNIVNNLIIFFVLLFFDFNYCMNFLIQSNHIIIQHSNAIN